jgi:polyisoprenoid-binding protein YceI
MTETTAQPQAPLTRTVDGAELPVPGIYAIDASHSAVEFVVRHLGLSKVRGGFGAFDGIIEIADRPEASRVSVDVALASLDTREPNRDEHLRASDFFDVPNHPTMSFRSTRVTGSGTDWTLEGRPDAAGRHQAGLARRDVRGHRP